MAFVSGQRVTIVPPSTMAGLHGIVQGPTKGLEAFTVRLDGAIIICPTKNLVSHHGRNDTSSEDEDEDRVPPLLSSYSSASGGNNAASAATASGTHVTSAALLHHWNQRLYALEETSKTDAAKIDLLERKVVAMESQAESFWEMHSRSTERIEKLEKRQGRRADALEETAKTDAVKIATLEEDAELMQGVMREMREEMSVMRRQFSGMSRDLSAAEGSINILLRATTEAFR